MTFKLSYVILFHSSFIGPFPLQFLGSIFLFYILYRPKFKVSNIIELMAQLVKIVVVAVIAILCAALGVGLKRLMAGMSPMEKIEKPE